MTSSAPVSTHRRNKDESGTRPEAYTFWTRELVRFADLDINGHVNNIAFAIYAESGRAAFLHDAGLWSLGDPSRQNVLAHIEIDYLQELKYPADIRVGLRVLKIGRSSFQLGAGIFSGERCVAVARSVQVRIDSQSKAPIALSDEERRMLQPYLVDSGTS
jgi:acyl-CoA thioester hydrolase